MSSSSTRKRKNDNSNEIDPNSEEFKKQEEQAKSDLLAVENFQRLASKALNMKGGIFGNGKSQNKTKHKNKKQKKKNNSSKSKNQTQRELPSVLSYDSTVDKAFSTKDCFATIKTYIENKKTKKKKNLDNKELVEELIIILNKKGFSIDPAKFDEFYKQICEWSKINVSTKSVNAAEFFGALTTWFDPTVNAFDINKTREFFSNDDHLSKIIAAHVPNYRPMYIGNDDNSAEKVDAAEKKYFIETVLRVEQDNKPLYNHNFKKVPLNKKKCGTCWLCGLDIYSFEYKHTFPRREYIKNGIKKYKTRPQIVNCGEDEHVIPPFIGNILGTLHFNFDLTAENFQGKKNILAQGLKPSHRYCNQIKNQSVFISFPEEGGKCSINTDMIDTYMGLFKDGFTRNLYLDDPNKFALANHFNNKNNNKKNQNNLNIMKQNIIDTLTPIMGVLNQLKATVYITMRLKTLWCLANACIRMVNGYNKNNTQKSRFSGGSNDIDLVNIYSELEQIFTYIFTPGEPSCSINNSAILIDKLEDKPQFKSDDVDMNNTNDDDDMNNTNDDVDMNNTNDDVDMNNTNDDDMDDDEQQQQLQQQQLQLQQQQQQRNEELNERVKSLRSYFKSKKNMLNELKSKLDGRYWKIYSSNRLSNNNNNNEMES